LFALLLFGLTEGFKATLKFLFLFTARVGLYFELPSNGP
jgi:hypothetical protein